MLQRSQPVAATASGSGSSTSLPGEGPPRRAKQTAHLHLETHALCWRCASAGPHSRPPARRTERLFRGGVLSQQHLQGESTTHSLGMYATGRECKSSAPAHGSHKETPVKVADQDQYSQTNASLLLGGSSQLCVGCDVIDLCMSSKNCARPCLPIAAAKLARGKL